MMARSLALLLLLVAAQARAQWPMVRGDPAGRAVAELATGNPVEIPPWRFRGGSHVWGYQPGMAVWSSAAVGLVDKDPVVVVGSYDHNIYCLDARSGLQLWRFPTGAGVYATPALGRTADGTPAVFAAASDRLVYALDARSGRRLWVHSIKSWRPTIGGARLAAPAVGRVGARSAVFVAHWIWDKSLAGHMQAAGVTALEMETGKRLWHAPLGDNQLASPIVATLRDGKQGQPTLFVASENGNVYALEAATGRVLWTRTARNGIKATPAFFHGKAGRDLLVIGSRDGVVRCLDARSGQPRWRFKTGHWVDGSAAVATVSGERRVFVGSYDTRLYALSAETGQVRWSHRTAGGIYSSPTVISDGGTPKVLVASWDHHLYCLDARDGALLWSAYTGRPLWDRVPLGESIWASPTGALIDQQAVVYFGSYSGELLAIPVKRAALATRTSSNLDFWVTMPIALLCVSAVAIGLTRRHRRRDHAAPLGRAAAFGRGFPPASPGARG